MADEPTANESEPAEAADAAAAIARAETAERQLAFVKAGIDYDSGLGSLLFQVYTGEPDPEKIKAEAIERGILQAPADEGPSISPEEEALTAQRRAVHTGASADDGSEHPVDGAIRVGEEAMRTKTRDDAMVDAIRHIATAAKNGDQRVMIREGSGRR